MSEGSESQDRNDTQSVAERTALAHKPLVCRIAANRPFEAEPAQFLAELERLAFDEQAGHEAEDE